MNDNTEARHEPRTMDASAPNTRPMSPRLSPANDEGAVVVDNITTSPTNADFDVDITDAELYARDTGTHSPPPPPPHIAARFYRNKANTRRKSSAASSRRNSMSSVHSHASSLSHRRSSTPGRQSNHVAQHLRRASIIESRKARLADRAAHAEQVRLRAALVKAAPRGSINNSEEKALAAQVAKEKYLAKVAAACAEEVARAKRVAEEVKERKMAEEARARTEMEERQAEAEKRRVEYQRNLLMRRARRAESAEKKLAVLDEVADIDEEAVDDAAVSDCERKIRSLERTTINAARRIQRAWWQHKRGTVVRMFTDLKLSERTKSLSFGEMTAIIAEGSTIKATTAVLTQLGLQDKDDENAALNTRTFLSAYMIEGHPLSVLNNKNGDQEQDLIQKATDLRCQFETTVSRLAPWFKYVPNETQLETLSQAYTAYTSAFAAWRLQDSSVLIEGMVATFVELDAIWQTVKDDTRGEVASDYRQGIRDNQIMLLSRIRKLAGPDRADFLIKKAIRESRKHRPKKRPAAEVRPRGVEAASSEAAATSAQSEDSTVEDYPYAPSASELERADVTKIFTPLPSNRVLTHELAIDKEYRLEDSASTSKLREQLFSKISEDMKFDFEKGNGSSWTVSAADNIREKLLRMLKPGNSMYQLVSETLDLEDIRRQCQQEVFSYQGFFHFMAHILPKLCAPFRDDEVKALVEELQNDNDELGIMIGKLFKLLKMVDLLSLDYTNFMIMSAAPTLIREAAGYEQRMFAKDLDNGLHTLDKTKRWWRAASVQLAAEADRRDPEGVRTPEDRPSTQKIYSHALLNLAIDQGELDAEGVPETLMLDFKRLRRIRADAIRITVIGAILLTAKNLLKRDSRSQWKPEATRLWQLLSKERYDSGANGSCGSNNAEPSDEPSVAQKAFSILESAHNMPPTTKQQISGTITRFFAQAVAGAETSVLSIGHIRSTSLSSLPASPASARFTDPVLKVLFQRLKTHVSTRLSASTSSERVRAASGASEALASSGMPEFGAQVSKIVESLDRIREVDWRAHEGWLEQVKREVDVEVGSGQ